MEQLTLTGQTQTTRGKTCSHCHTWLPFSAFAKASRGLYGRHSKCRRCNNSIRRTGSSYERAEQSMSARCARAICGPTTFPTGIVCSLCSVWYPRSAFWFNVADGSWRRECFHCRANARSRSRRTASSNTGANAFRDAERASYDAVGVPYCGGCRSTCRPTELRTNRRGEQICRYCQSAGSLRSQGVSVYGVDLRSAWDQQSGRCAACNVELLMDKEDRGNRRTAHAHHCHDTNSFLDWLCRNCNMAEGLLKTATRAALLSDYMNRRAA